MIELNVSCPNVETGLVMGADPAETARGGRARPPADRQAADREAHAERDRARRRGGGRRGGRRRRGLADQHAQGDGAPPADPRAVARRPHRRRVRARPCARSRWSRSRAVARAVEIPVIGMGGIATGPPRGRFHRRGRHLRRRRHRELPRSGRRPPDRRRARRPALTGSAPSPQPRRSAEPVWGTRPGGFAAECGNFRVRSDLRPICSIKTPANDRKNAQGPRTTLKLRSRSS